MDANQERQIFVTVAESVQRLDNVEARVDKLENTTAEIQSLTLSVQKLALSVEQMAKEHVTFSKNQNEISKRLLEVEQYPTKKKAAFHDRIMDQVLSLLVGAVVGFLVFYFFGI